MGKGDKKSRRGKISMGTFGVRRPKKSNAPAVQSAPAAKSAEKAEAKPEEKKARSVSGAKKKTEKK